MQIKFDSNVNEKELVNYILGYLIFVSVFFINIRLVQINILLSLIIFIIINLIASMYIGNFNKYSIFKYDFIIFNLLFYFFSTQYLINLTKNILNMQILSAGNLLIYIIILITILNHIILIYKWDNIKQIKILIIVTNYLFATFLIITMFGNVYINLTNNTISKFINENFILMGNEYVSKMQCFSDFKGDYLSYGKSDDESKLTSTNEDINNIQVKETIKSVLNPVNNITDYILFSTSNYFNSSNNGIKVYGDNLKWNVIYQKLILIVLTIATLVGAKIKY